MKKILSVAIFLASSLGVAVIPNFKLVDQEGKTFEVHSLKGKYVFVSFIYTRCPQPKVCPMTVHMNQKLLKEWKKTLPDKELRLVLVTLDPAFDTPKVMREFAKARHLDLSHFILLSGDKKVIDNFETQFNILAVERNNEISHNNRSALLAPDLSEIGRYEENGWDPQTVIRDVTQHQKKP